MSTRGSCKPDSLTLQTGQKKEIEKEIPIKLKYMFKGYAINGIVHQNEDIYKSDIPYDNIDFKYRSLPLPQEIPSKEIFLLFQTQADLYAIEICI